MGSSEKAKLVELVIKESEEGLLLESLESATNSQLNSHKTVVLDLSFDNQQDIIFTKFTFAAIDPNAIVCLNLSRCNLDYFPDAFANLKLKRLNLSHNKLEDVPDCLLNGLRFLENLDLSYNQLNSFDFEPKCVIKLRMLRINNNKLLNIPPWILQVNCFNLEKLYYSYNEIHSLKRSRFRNVSSYRLKKLELRNCLLRSADVNFLKDIRTLTYLDLSNEAEINRNCFASSDSFSQVLVNPLWDDRLTILRLNDLNLSFLPEEIGKLIALEELYISKNELLWLPDSLSLLGRLRILDISYNHILSLPKTVENLKKLEILLASYNSISRTPDFCSTNLKVLDLYSNCLDVDCDIKISSSINEADLERNFIDTRQLTDQGYEAKKEALRLGLVESRLNGPKEQHEEENDRYDDASTDSEWDCNDQGAVEGGFKDDLEEEESWSPKRELCDNGCTFSDNEWLGSERAYVSRKKAKRVLKTYPDWMFEDD